MEEIARLIASVSSVTPSPLAPNFFTYTIGAVIALTVAGAPQGVNAPESLAIGGDTHW